jgi:hypothetical protein
VRVVSDDSRRLDRAELFRGQSLERGAEELPSPPRNWPLVRVVPIGAPFPPCWTEGSTVQFKSYVFGIISIGVRTLHFEKIDQTNYQLQSREHDPLVARWDHLISIKPLGDNRTVYRDTIDIDAGSLTFVVWTWANGFYRHRQRRWRALARSL